MDTLGGKMDTGWKDGHSGWVDIMRLITKGTHMKRIDEVIVRNIDCTDTHTHTKTHTNTHTNTNISNNILNNNNLLKKDPSSRLMDALQDSPVGMYMDVADVIILDKTDTYTNTHIPTHTHTHIASY
eukprot:GHVR01177318.1.p2 GENE.GHVR01177318.1~~GHVR01177318.1.p2  ORF type:complete len:127 (+),score=72.41 GHVR01177318.1:199-579(+)